jgi:tRNA(Arg) A34 adenosine deaminase TadA
MREAHRHLTMMYHFSLTLPEWTAEIVQQQKTPLKSSLDQMKFVVALANENIRRNNGGPFAAAVFERTTGKLIGAGVNLVEASQASFAHAEMVALLFAQQAVGSFTLKTKNVVLVSSAEPCAMCCGSIVWSGVSEVVTAARIEDAESALGFDEGPVHPQWKQELQKRGVAVTEGPCRDEVLKIYAAYKERGGLIYN